MATERRDTRRSVEKVGNGLLWVVYVWVVIDLVLLFLAFTLRFLGAKPDAGFVEWVYRSVERAMAPFRGIFEPLTITDQAVLDTSLLFAMIIYGLAALFLRSAIAWVTSRIVEQQTLATIAAAGGQTSPHVAPLATPSSTYPSSTPAGQVPPAP